MWEMKISRFSCAIPVLLALAGCEDSSSSSSGSDTPSIDLQGTWLHREASELRDRLQFQGDRVQHESYRMGCQVSLTRGTWTLQGNILRVMPDTAWARSYDPDSRDSASYCAWEASEVTVTGTLSRELANIASSSFDLKSHKIKITEAGMTDSVILERFVRQ